MRFSLFACLSPFPNGGSFLSDVESLFAKGGKQLPEEISLFIQSYPFGLFIVFIRLKGFMEKKMTPSGLLFSLSYKAEDVLAGDSGLRFPRTWGFIKYAWIITVIYRWCPDYEFLMPLTMPPGNSYCLLCRSEWKTDFVHQPVATLTSHARKPTCVSMQYVFMLKSPNQCRTTTITVSLTWSM